MAKTKPAKTSKKPDTSHHFIDGYSSRSGLLGVVAFPNRLRATDTEFTTFYTTIDDDWSHEIFDFDGRSVAYRGDRRTGEWWILGKRGEIARIGDEISREQIPEAGTGPDGNGYLNRIALVGDRLYVCGFRRQVCTHDGRRWRRMDEGILEPRTTRGSSLESIDGIDADCIYAVGSMGQIWHFDGRRWTQRASPTSADLHEVRCLDRDHVVIVGQRGTILVGARDDWALTTGDDPDDDLWGVEHFNGDTYVAGLSGIRKLKARGVEPVDTGQKKVIPGYRLRAKEGVLWSIGSDDILSFDGTAWRLVVCPDNAP